MEKGKSLIQINSCGFLFPAYPISLSQLRKCLNIAKSGISTAVYPVNQHGTWGFFLEGIDSQTEKTHCITDRPRKGAQTPRASWTVLTSNGRSVWPCIFPDQHISPSRLQPGVHA